MSDVFKSLAMSDNVAVDFIDLAVKGFPVKYSLKFLMIFINQSKNSLTASLNDLVSFSANSLPKCLLKP